MDIEISKIIHGPLEVDPEILKETMESICSMGLLHPISVLESNGNFELLTGKKRLRAFIELGKTKIPATVVKVDKSRATEVALHENLMRSNLPWWEIVELEAEFHNLRLEQHGQRRTGRPIVGDKSGWSLTDTANELGRALGAVSQDLNLATMLKLNPHLKNVGDKATALKLARQIARREQAEIAALDPASGIEDQVLFGNSLHVLKEIQGQTYNVCITDPPWSQYKDEELTADEDTLPVFQEVYRVLSNDSTLYMVVSTPDFFKYSQELPKFGFKVQQHPLIWAKDGTITHGKRSWEYARDYEPILVAAKGNPILTSPTEMSSVITVRAISSTKLTHPHEKPVELITKLIKDSSYAGAKVLDPFGGSGVLATACKLTDRRYTVIERNRKFYEQIVRRING